MSDNDSWGVMRSRTWDLPDRDDGRPEDRLDVLLGSLGAFGKTIAEQQAALRPWLESPPAQAAPRKLLDSVRAFLEVSAGE